VAPGEIPGKSGSIIRVWPLEGGGPMGADADAFRILCRSTGLNGQPITVSGAIFIPAGSAPAGGRNVLAWYHYPIAGVVEPNALSIYEKMATDCIEGVPEFLAIDKAEKPLQHQKF
jgi:hypothetical protein